MTSLTWTVLHVVAAGEGVILRNFTTESLCGNISEIATISLASPAIGLFVAGMIAVLVMGSRSPGLCVGTLMISMHFQISMNVRNVGAAGVEETNSRHTCGNPNAQATSDTTIPEF